MCVSCDFGVEIGDGCGGRVQGDFFMQQTYLAVVAEIMDERAILHGLVC
jgi:hypothetical protein